MPGSPGAGERHDPCPGLYLQDQVGVRCLSRVQTTALRCAQSRRQGRPRGSLRIAFGGSLLRCAQAASSTSAQSRQGLVVGVGPGSAGSVFLGLGAVPVFRLALYHFPLFRPAGHCGAPTSVLVVGLSFRTAPPGPGRAVPLAEVRVTRLRPPAPPAGQPWPPVLLSDKGTPDHSFSRLPHVRFRMAFWLPNHYSRDA